ncbi:MAG TPA: DUF222 domain-containing protein, partial [Mycobacteriales bacterium]|nr:DUF222 domain-containing protein [Mycobacteriales bacterium]
MQPIHPANQALYDRVADRLDALEAMPVGAELYSGLIALQSTAMDSAGAVRTTALWLKLAAHCEAQSMIPTAEAVTSADLLAEGYGLDAPELVAHELAAMTSTPYATSLARVGLADQVREQLPASWVALDRGEISLTHLKAMARVVAVADAKVAEAVEARVLPSALEQGWTPTQLGRAALRVLLVLDPEAARRRAAAAKDGADVRFYPGTDDMATLVADGDAEPLRRTMDAVEVKAAALRREGDPRSVGQRRVAALAELVLGRPDAKRPTVETVVTVDLTTLLGLTQRPGELSGYGPITAEYARELSKQAWLRRLLTDPVDGRMLDLGRRRYRPSAALRRMIEARDRTCRHVGCSRRASDSDIDHRVEWPDGATDADNLGPRCRMHHIIKTKSAWRVDIEPDGTEVYTSVLDFRYRRSPAVYPIDLLDPPDELEIPAGPRGSDPPDPLG